MNARQAQALAGHADLAAHERYLRNTTKVLEIPAAALPDWTSVVLPQTWSKPVNTDSLIQVDSCALGRIRTCDIRFRRAA